MTGKGEMRVLDYEHVQRSKLRTDVRLRLMEKFAPDRYGPSPAVEIVATREAELERLAGLSDEQRLQEARELIETARRRLAMAEWTGQLGDSGITDVPEEPESAPK